MSKIFETQFEKGSYIDRIDNRVGTPTDSTFKRTERGLAAYFDRNDGDIRIALSGGDNNIGTVHTICVGFKIKEKITTQTMIGDIGSSNSYLAFASSNDTIRYNAGLDIVQMNMTGNIGLDWHFLIVTRNGAALITYVDDKSGVNGTLTTGASSDFVFDMLGNLNGYSLPWHGYLSKVEIYDHLLTAKERAQAYNEFLNAQPLSANKFPRHNPFSKPTDLSNEPGLVAAWNFIVS
jgi:hypothetical protein